MSNSNDGLKLAFMGVAFGLGVVALATSDVDKKASMEQAKPAEAAQALASSSRVHHPGIDWTAERERRRNTVWTKCFKDNYANPQWGKKQESQILYGQDAKDFLAHKRPCFVAK